MDMAINSSDKFIDLAQFHLTASTKDEQKSTRRLFYLISSVLGLIASGKVHRSNPELINRNFHGQLQIHSNQKVKAPKLHPKLKQPYLPSLAPPIIRQRTEAQKTYVADEISCPSCDMLTDQNICPNQNCGAIIWHEGHISGYESY